MELKETYLKNSMIPKRYLQEINLDASGGDLETFKELDQIRQNIGKFVNEGDNLLIYSSHVGNGKTTWATKLGRSYIDYVSKKMVPNMTPVVFVNVNNFLTKKKMSISDPSLKNDVDLIEKNILTSKLVIFDDICVSGLSPYDMNYLYFWIDERTNKMLSSIYTSNLTPDQLKSSSVLDPRISSRILNYSITKCIKDGDHRGC